MKRRYTVRGQLEKRAIFAKLKFQEAVDHTLMEAFRSPPRQQKTRPKPGLEGSGEILSLFALLHRSG